MFVWDIPMEIWRYVFLYWGVMALGSVAGSIIRWRRNRRVAERERAAWEKVSS
jgi:hypothetical protein